MSYNQVIVVEGKHDEQKIKSVFPGADCIVTNGSGITNETLNLIYETSLRREIILFLDPDFPGKKITNQILETGGNFKIAFLPKSKAISKNKRKVGIEHASNDDIISSLQSYFTIAIPKSNITTRDLMDRRLIHYSGSKLRRDHLCQTLNIPLLNGKALAKMLNMLNIDLERVDSIIEQ